MTTPNDLFMTALCVWREARNQGDEGMRAVANVIRNRAIRNSTNPYYEITKKLQFSSITAPGDAQLALWPVGFDTRWTEAQQIAADVLGGSAIDNTGGAVDYYNPDAIRSTKTFQLGGALINFPDGWNAAVLHQTVTIGSRPNMHVFFKET